MRMTLFVPGRRPALRCVVAQPPQATGSVRAALLAQGAGARRRLLVAALAFLILLRLVASAEAAAFAEAFSSDPADRGWRTVGDTSLFQWNPASQNLKVTWDSGRPNSYFYRPLGTIMAKSDDFSLAFDLVLEEMKVGVTPNKPFTFQIALGFLNFKAATQTNFVRGTGAQSPHLVEFNYFPDSGFGATVSPVVVSSNNQFIPSFSFPLELIVGDLFHVAMTYRGSNQTLATTMTRNGQPFGPVKDVRLPTQFSDFRVDTLAISSYNDAGAGGSLFARGRLDNLALSISDPPIADLVGNLRIDGWSVEFAARTNWLYALERTEDFKTWISLGPPRPGTGRRDIFVDSDLRQPKAFYQIRAERP
ncbi:MAG: hypothetical protein HY735_10010 [Verrucomicrobia bacterium]|nr:hypothetical protein [Verrucomicrobiota bacterium]